MVTCSKCGTKNPDDARFCVSCGAALYSMGGERRRGETCFGQPERRIEDECFGLPHGGTIVALFIGLIIVVFGVGNLVGWRIDWGPFIMIVIGVLIVSGAIYGFMRRR
ncbi:zinc ribbon domain-containing protein [Candidatus Bathyarchaeota archaeon]|nr:zinc ribbon domain-containing protein [Candidatus Bathyarchaeota archaeon]